MNVARNLLTYQIRQASADQLPLEDRFSEMSHTGPVGITIFLGYAKKLLNKFF